MSEAEDAERVCGECGEPMSDETGEFVGEENLLVHEGCVDAPEHPPVGCEDWGDGMYPLHEEWATGTIGDEDREYRVLRSLQGPHVLVEFPKGEYDDYPNDRCTVAFNIGDMVQHAHSFTKEEVDDE